MTCELLYAVIAGGSGVLGAFVGGLATYLATKRQIEAAAKTQLRVQLVDHCRTYFHSVAKALGIAELRAEPGAVVSAAALDLQKTALRAAAEAHAWLAVIGTRAIRGATSALNAALPNRLLAEGLLPPDQDEAKQVSERIRAKLDEFLTAVRAESL